MNTIRGKYIIVVGGGLAGLTSALTIATDNPAHKVLLIEKENVLGGNSAKASSGINGSETDLQRSKRINDTNKEFFIDTYKSANKDNRELSEDSNSLIARLVLRSKGAIEWLNTMGVEFDEVNVLGGHKIARTHRNSKQIHVGSHIMGVLIEKAQSLPNINIMTGTSVDELLKNQIGVIGVRCNYQIIYADSVILATGGFAHNFDMVKTYRPDLFDLPTTNGTWAKGEGLDIMSNIGAGLVDMDKIQVHPTGFVDINDRDNKTKYLAAELLRGVGGILINNKGKRFCNELGTRSYITKRMMEEKQNKKGFLLIIPKGGYNDAKRMIDYYLSKDLLRKYNIKYISRRYHINESTLRKTINDYNNVAGKGHDDFDKRRFPNTPFNESNEFYVGLVTPTLHYCMGGVKINKHTQVVREDNSVIDRLFAIGEVTGGLHGDNRLGGNSLLECVVYGRIAGLNSTKLPNLPNVSESMDIYEKMVDVVELRDIDRDELEKHKRTDDAWLVLYDKVYDVTELISSHPGGSDSILMYAGRDATKVFEGIHAKSLLSQMKIIGRYTGPKNK